MADEEDNYNHAVVVGNPGEVAATVVIPDLVERGVSTGYLCPIGRVLKASDCLEGSNQTMSFSEGNVLKGLMLQFKHGSTSKGSINGWKNVGFNGAQKRQKVVSSFPYNRLAIFADLADPPNCFAVIADVSREVKDIYEECQQHDFYGVGSVFYVLEPRRTSNYLGDSVPIIETRLPILPLKLSTQALYLSQNIRSFEMKKDKDIALSYFVKHNVNVEFSFFRLLTSGVSCTGRFCDRALPLEPLGMCGCFHTPAKHALVAEYSIRLAVPTNFNGSDEEGVENCRSFRTTDLFFENFSRFQQRRDGEIKNRFFKIRASVTAMENYVNQNGGWTVVGWYKKGEVDDISTPGDKIDSLNWKFHVSLLVPTLSTIRNKEDPAFNALRIKNEPPGNA